LNRLGSSYGGTKLCLLFRCHLWPSTTEAQGLHQFARL
jgi:hypothetical protein